MSKVFSFKHFGLFIGIALMSISTSSAQEDSIIQKQLNWYNHDPLQQGIIGVSTEKAYNELLKGRSPKKKVVVAVIDSGVDIFHEDLKGKIWVNADEIPGNGIDDDKNGFIDDINGWSFLGNANGQNYEFDNYELTRVYKKLNERFGNKAEAEISKEDKKEFEVYQSVKAEYLQKYTEAKTQYDQIVAFGQRFSEADDLIAKQLGKDYTPDELKAYTPENEDVAKAKNFLATIFSRGFTKAGLDEAKKHFEKQLNYHYNPDYNPRTIVGDDPENKNDSIYGNNDVKGPGSMHGTFVSGIIAANRNNDLGINGIADNVEIMVLRAVPDGDERDKDIANAIKYAVRNGADIINMSFGKLYSPQKAFVDEAVKMAEAKGVLMVHAAGNSGENNDEIVHYPINTYADNEAMNWLTVGANSIALGEKLAARFTNYGKKSVDVFAPGVDVYSTAPESEYEISSGTSFSAPAVTGVAALVLSYYPELTDLQLKEIIMKSVSPYKKIKVLKPGTDPEAGKLVKFKKLSVTGGVVNAYNALRMAEELSKK